MLSLQTPPQTPLSPGVGLFKQGFRNPQANHVHPQPRDYTTGGSSPVVELSFDLESDESDSDTVSGDSKAGGGGLQELYERQRQQRKGRTHPVSTVSGRRIAGSKRVDEPAPCAGTYTIQIDAHDCGAIRRMFGGA
ncbi:hypothetical protein H0H92_005722 [Tricholoma furcatifolium]|nr:hypothetical protein H0H92_005722 [Tricholoma furcatifolium]